MQSLDYRVLLERKYTRSTQEVHEKCTYFIRAPEGARDNLGNTVVHGRPILKWILKK
jgi:hypothetical protein